MRIIIAAGVICVLLPTAGFAETESASAAACERLAKSLSFPNTTSRPPRPWRQGSSSRPAGGGGAAAGAASLPAFCRVALTIAPSPDSDIKSEVWLPLSGWNGKFLQVGNGAWGGSIQYGPLGDALRRGYAAASTDTGHTGTDASFAMGHPEKLIDFGYRSVHETAVQGKATVAALYGDRPRVSYFNGCSGGGRMSFMEAQRFPEDFDGIIAGAPGYNRTDVAFQTLGMAHATHVSPESFIPAGKYPALHQAALDKCDVLDGLKDGLIADPTKCRFDPAVLECKGGDGPGCLTKAQVVAARKIYAPVIDPKTGAQISSGLEPGSELQWGGGCRQPTPSDVQRPPQIRRHEGSELGLPDARCQPAAGAGSKGRQRRAVRDIDGADAVREPRRQVAHLPRLERSEHSAARVGQLLQRAREDHGQGEGG